MLKSMGSRDGSLPSDGASASERTWNRPGKSLCRSCARGRGALPRELPPSAELRLLASSAPISCEMMDEELDGACGFPSLTATTLG